MKKLYLLSHRLLRYFEKNKVIFILFLVGGILSSLTLTYMYENFMPSIANSNSQEIYYREYTVYDSGTGENSEGFGDCDFDAILSEMEESGLFSSISLSCREDGVKVYGLYSGEAPVSIEIGLSGLSSDSDIIIPADDITPVGGTVNISGTDFTVVGRQTLSGEYYITYQAYKSLSFETMQIYAVAAERQNFSDDKAEAYLYELFPDAYVKTPEIYEIFDASQSANTMILICGCYAVAVVSFMFLLCYLIDSCMDENTASLIVGARKSDITVMIFWECLVLTSLSNALGLLLHAALYEPLFSKINVTDGGRLGVGNYLTLFLFMFVISAVVVLAFQHRYAKLSPAAARRLEAEAR
ncbi:MAG: hypothetical protein LUE25_05865 [Clostridiales bacterium]|nr:hypothetical protein [Clostridiales bacterium]